MLESCFSADLCDDMSNGLIDKVYIGFDNAPPAFDIRGRLLGTNGTNLEYIRTETGVVAILKGDKYEPLHLVLHHNRSEALVAARSLALNLIETIRAELAQWTAAQSAGPPAMNMPPPSLTTASASASLPAPTSTMTYSTSSTLTTTSLQPSTVISPVVSVAPAPAPLMTVRQPTVLQLLPQQQQYVLNQENGQLIPIVQPGVQVSNSNFTSLPIAQHLGLQQPNFGTQLVDISNVQPVNVTQLRLSGVPSSMSMILPNGLTLPQGNITGGTDTTTVSAISAPVVCAAPSTNSSQKIYYSTDKSDKDIKYHIQSPDMVQWTVPGSQTMLIPYHQLQELTNQGGFSNLQPQQYVSISPAGGLQQTSLPLSAAQFQQLQTTGTIMPFNHKPTVSSASLINIISTGQASSPQNIAPNMTSTKSSVQSGTQESRGQKRLSDGTPSQLQLRPIAPAGSVQDKNSSRDMRTMWSSTARDNVATSAGMKINPTQGTIIHVSSGQQTSFSTTGGVSQDGQGMFIKQLDKNSIQFQTTKDGQKQDLTGKFQTPTQNVQMITVPPGMTVLQNPLSIGQMPTVLGQPNSQVYMIPANQSNIVQAGALGQGLIGQQVLQPGQNVTVMQPNQLTVPNSVQYNTLMPMNMNPNAQYLPTGIHLNNQLTAQQFNAALANQHLTHPNLSVSNTIPIVQANPSGSPINAAQTIPVTQPTPIHQVMHQNSTYMTSGQSMQNTVMPTQYILQPNASNLPLQSNTTDLHYSVQTNQSTNTQEGLASTANNQTTTNTESESSTNPPNANTTDQSGYISSSSQQAGYTLASAPGVQNATQQNYSPDPTTNQNTSTFTTDNQSTNSQSYDPATPTQPNVSNPNYNVTSQPTPPQTPGNYSTNNASNPPAVNENTYASNTGPNVPQANFSPSATPAPQNNQPNSYIPQSYPSNQQGNPYPNATGQNMTAYANNQYQYNRPWFRSPSPGFASTQGRSFNNSVPPPNGPPMPVPGPTGNYNYWQDS